jgi:hypothetical protein
MRSLWSVGRTPRVDARDAGNPVTEVGPALRVTGPRRGVCPSWKTRRIVAAAAHLTDHAFPRPPVRQWVLAVPKRLCCFLQGDADFQGAALCRFRRVVDYRLRARSPGSGPAERSGAVVVIHRFGSMLNARRHFH